MSEITPKSKSNKLTLFIFIALIAGIALGFVLNKSYVQQENQTIAQLESRQQQNVIAATPVATTEDAQKVWKEQKAIVVKARDKKLEPFSLMADIFLRLIKMIVAPLVFSTLVVGVAKLGDIKAVGRIGGKTLLWFFSASLLSLFLGMLLVNLFQPGAHMHLALPDTTIDLGIQKSAFSIANFLHHIFPTSIFQAMAENEILQIVIFSLLFGTATAAIGEKGKIIIAFFEAVADVILKITGYVMNLAPVAVFGAMVAIIAKQGPSILKTYSIFIFSNK